MSCYSNFGESLRILTEWFSQYMCCNIPQTSVLGHHSRGTCFNMLSETAPGGLLPIDRVASESTSLLLKGHRGLIISSLVGAVIICGPEYPGNSMHIWITEQHMCACVVLLHARWFYTLDIQPCRDLHDYVEGNFDMFYKKKITNIFIVPRRRHFYPLTKLSWNLLEN